MLLLATKCISNIQTLDRLMANAHVIFLIVFLHQYFPASPSMKMGYSITVSYLKIIIHNINIYLTYILHIILYY